MQCGESALEFKARAWRRLRVTLRVALPVPPSLLFLSRPLHSGQRSVCSAGTSALLGGLASHQQGPSQLWPPSCGCFYNSFQVTFWPKSLKPLFRKNARSLPSFFYSFILFFFFNCLFQEQSYKIKISSGKENLIQTFLRIDSTTFLSQTKQKTNLLHS